MMIIHLSTCILNSGRVYYTITFAHWGCKLCPSLSKFMAIKNTLALHLDGYKNCEGCKTTIKPWCYDYCLFIDHCVGDLLHDVCPESSVIYDEKKELNK